MDASQGRRYRMLLGGGTVASILHMLEDEHQRPVATTQATLEQKLVGLYFAAAWSAECDAFRAQLLGVSSAHSDDLAVVHISADNHPADMARTMAGTGWLCIPWGEHALRQDLMQQLGVSRGELPRLVVVDGCTHRVISTAARADVERRPLTCVHEWRRSRAGESWRRAWALAWYLALLGLACTG
ncbi:hypothetical protein H4R18_004668 [Coemansia javaensis]|uniref:Thioredoxin-like fold domain-containing protein n=1 Tax=Coemansia javaensis TaxID=2761396 RepID=A0A9W8LEH6_9FUNG|nr:hypothetical protein H4R18_004668 [Coemansia javaensis]